MKTANNNEPTARELYQERSRDITRLISLLKQELKNHAANAKTAPRDFGYAGDLGYVREQLVNLVAFKRNSEPEDIETLLNEGC